MTILISMCQRAHLPLVDEGETKVVSVDRRRVFDKGADDYNGLCVSISSLASG